jgi:hypothetical protein
MSIFRGKKFKKVRFRFNVRKSAFELWISFVNKRRLKAPFAVVGVPRYLATTEKRGSNVLHNIADFRVTKCDFHKFGPSGTIVNIDVMCVLPQNAFSEKMFAVMWFWCIGLAVVTAVDLIHVLGLILIDRMRIAMIRV